jgi:polyisoprenoid-binding protein YceI
MKKIVLSVVMLASVALFSFTPKTSKIEETNFTVDATKSKVDFTGSKTSDFHTGYFPVKSGSVKVIDGKLVGGSFTVNVAGIKVTDGAGDNLMKHLMSADFLDAVNFADATFTINSVNYTRADRATITGDLNLHGIKAPITFTAYIRSVDAAKGFFAEAFFPLDRTVFGVKYGIGAIDTDVQLAIHLYAKK